MAFVGLIGGIISAVGTIAGGMAQANAANYQAQVAANNAIIAQQNATYAIEAGQAKTAARSMQEAEIGGQIKAAEAAGGVDVNTGSNKDVQISQRMLGKLNTEQELANAQLTEYGYLSQKMNYQAQSQLYGYEAKTAETGAALGALGGVVGAASKWYNPTSSDYSSGNYGGTGGGLGGLY
jgi:hypothetical protein